MELIKEIIFTFIGMTAIFYVLDTLWTYIKADNVRIAFIIVGTIIVLLT